MCVWFVYWARIKQVIMLMFGCRALSVCVCVCVCFSAFLSPGPIL